MIHEGQRVPLGLEPGQDLRTVHARLDNLEGDLAANRLELLGHVDNAHAPLADLLEELVRADVRAGHLGRGLLSERAALAGRGSFQETLDFGISGQQLLQPHPELLVVAAGLIEVLRPIFKRFDGQGSRENDFGLGV
jgi:hypothetical protein